MKCAVAFSIKGRRQTKLNCNRRSINSQIKCKKTTLMLFFCFLLKLMRIKNVRNWHCINKKRTKLRSKQCWGSTFCRDEPIEQFRSQSASYSVQFVVARCNTHYRLFWRCFQLKARYSLVNIATNQRTFFIKDPAYDVEDVQTGIVHIDVGGFHRPYEAMYVDRITPASTNDDIATLKAQGVGNTLLFYALNFINWYKRKKRPEGRFLKCRFLCNHVELVHMVWNCFIGGRW